MLEVFDLQRRKRAILQNAHGRIETEQINTVNSFQFTLPEKDDKNKHCKVFHYVSNSGGPLYRIMAPARQEENTSIKSYQCEHVIATLIDDVLFGQHVVGNRGMYTADVIRYILSFQAEKRWELAECDFNRQFEYAFENENLLAALFSVPNLFTEPYIWKFDTTRFPWRVSLKKINTAQPPQFYIRAKKNLLSFKEEKAAQEICTKLYCLGYGEGINQLGIEEVNGGSPFLLASPEKISEYGYISRIFVDRRFEDAQSLMERGKAILAELQEPTSAKTFSVADLYELTNDDLDKAEVGKMARFTEDGTTTYITGVTKNHDIPGDMQITLATKAVDVASTVADIADRQRINEVYSQGATQIYAQSIQANATQQIAAKMNFYIPAEMRIVNAVKLKIALSPFRSYSKATEGGGATTATSSAGGSTTVTSSAGGGVNATSSSGGATTATSSAGGSTTVTSAGGGASTITSSSGGSTSVTSSSGGSTTVTSGASSSSTSSEGGPNIDNYVGYSSVGGGNASTGTSSKTSGTPAYDRYASHSHNYAKVTYSYRNGTAGYGWHTHLFNYYTGHSHSIKHTHNVSIGSHSHSVSIGSHSHSVSISNHTHSVSIGTHTHTVQIGNHSHTVEIREHTHSITIKEHTHTVNIPNHTHNITQGIYTFGSPSGAALYVNGEYKCEVTPNEEMDITEYLTTDNGKISRGSWQSVEVLPNSLAYVTIDMMVQGFIQSRGGTTV